jgi:hypothetical protein
MGFIAGAIAGAAFGLLRTAVEDMLQDSTPDPAKIAAVKDAQRQRMEELLGEGVPRAEAFDQAKAETREAMKEAMTVTDNVTMGDYVGNMTTDALMGGGLGWAANTARGAKAIGGAKSFLGMGKKAAPRVESAIGGVRTTDPARTAQQIEASRGIKGPAVQDAMERIAAERLASKPPVPASVVDTVIAPVAKVATRRGRVQSVGSDVARSMEEKAAEAAAKGDDMMFKRLGSPGRPYSSDAGPGSFLGFGDDPKVVREIDDIINAALSKYTPVKPVAVPNRLP